jgi:hypothetical protein
MPPVRPVATPRITFRIENHALNNISFEVTEERAQHSLGGWVDAGWKPELEREAGRSFSALPQWQDVPRCTSS